jgi:inorganic pyrophosphatase
MIDDGELDWKMAINPEDPLFYSIERHRRCRDQVPWNYQWWPNGLDGTRPLMILSH